MIPLPLSRWNTQHARRWYCRWTPRLHVLAARGVRRWGHLDSSREKRACQWFRLLTHCRRRTVSRQTPRRAQAPSLPLRDRQPVASFSSRNGGRGVSLPRLPLFPRNIRQPNRGIKARGDWDRRLEFGD